MPDLGASELFLLILAALALFGARRLPDIARSAGRALRAFRAESAGLDPGDVRGKAEAPVSRGPLGGRGRAESVQRNVR